MVGAHHVCRVERHNLLAADGVDVRVLLIQAQKLIERLGGRLGVHVVRAHEHTRAIFETI